MSGDPPPGEKPRGPKPVAVTSSFINSETLPLRPARRGSQVC